MSKSNEITATRRGCSSNNFSAPHAVGQPGQSGALLRQLAGCPAGVCKLQENVSVQNAHRRRCRRLPPGCHSVAEVAEDIAHSPPSTVYAAIKTGRLKAASWRGQIIVATEDARDYGSIKPLQPAAADLVEARHG
jgi:hypothetical protein